MSQAISPNTTIGQYTIVSKIGAGGMGEVYSARDTRLDREVAIKIVGASFASDTERLKRFEQEARATSALNHPNILTVYDIGTHEGRFLRSINGNTSWAVTKDATRFLRIQLVESERAITDVDLVLNWFSKVKQRVSGGAK